MAKKKNVVFRAPLLTMSGYGVHARQVARWLLSRDDVNVTFQPVPWGVTPWLLDRTLHGGLIGDIFDRCAPSSVTHDVSFQLQLPNEWDPRLARINVGMTAGVETDVCNSKWIDAMNAMSLVIVPSTHVQRTFRSSGNVTVDARVVPEAADDGYASFDRSLHASDACNRKRCCFLIIGQLTGNNAASDRKNIFNTIRVLCDQFYENDDVDIVLKTNMGTNTFIDFNTTIQTIRKLVGEVRRGQHPRVRVIHGMMSNDELVRLYASYDTCALVSLTRGEGFGLPILEAACCDVPVIATAWSGHVDFMSRGRYINIDYELKQIPGARVDGNIFIDGARWAEFIETDARRKLQRFYEKSAIPKQWARELGMTLRDLHSMKRVCTLYNDAVSCIGM